MIQNSRSPVVKSRISSSSGRTMSVENRSFACTGTTSSLLYLTTRAPVSVANTPPVATLRSTPARNKVPPRWRWVLKENANDIVFSFELVSVLLRISIFKPARFGGCHQHDGGKQCGECEGDKCGTDAEAAKNLRKGRDHERPPARTSSPFSKPYCSKAS